MPSGPVEGIYPMISTLDIVPVHPDRDVVMRLLMATPGPVKPGNNTRLLRECQYRFTLDDIDSLVSAKRADLAELVLMSTSDTGLLDEVSRSRTLAVLARAVCRNRHTPPAVLLNYYSDSRKGVSGYARSALAHLLGCSVGDTDALVPAVEEILSCPNKDLLSVLERRCRNTWASVQFSLVMLARYRTTSLTEKMGDALVERAAALSTNHGVSALAAFAASNAVSIGLLMKIASSAPLLRHSARKILLERLDRLSQAQREDVYALFKDPDPFSARLGQHVPAGPYADEMYHFDAALRRFIADCPHLSSEVAAKWAQDLIQASPRLQPQSSPEEFAILAHPGVPTDVLQMVLTGTETRSPLTVRFPVAMQYVADNPNLTLEQQRLMFKLDGASLSSSALRSLASSGHLHSTFASELLDTMVGLEEQPASGTGQSSTKWAGPSVRLARTMLDNPAVPESVVRSVPVRALLGPSWGPVTSGACGLVRLADPLLRDNPSGWTELLTLLPEWDGTVGDLASVVAVV